MDDADRRMLVQYLMELLATGLTLWMLIPEHQRRSLLMAISARVRLMTQRIAKLTARWAVSRELSGDRDAATAGYRLTFGLMTGPHRRAERWYESLRDLP